jgi:hypothetical protein
VVIQQTGVIAMEINLELADNMNISMSRTFKFQWGYYNNSNKFIDKWLEANPIQRTIDRANALLFRNIH